MLKKYEIVDTRDGVILSTYKTLKEAREEQPRLDGIAYGRAEIYEVSRELIQSPMYRYGKTKPRAPKGS